VPVPVPLYPCQDVLFIVNVLATPLHEWHEKFFAASGKPRAILDISDIAPRYPYSAGMLISIINLISCGKPCAPPGFACYWLCARAIRTCPRCQNPSTTPLLTCASVAATPVKAAGGGRRACIAEPVHQLRHNLVILLTLAAPTYSAYTAPRSHNSESRLFKSLWIFL
jgi:hypothetical protein